MTTTTPSAPPPPPPAPPSAAGSRRTSPLARLRTFGRPPRLLGLDVARALAVLGMVAAHLAGVTSQLEWTDPGTWADLVNGRSSILFAVLAGVSIALVTGRTRRPEPADLPALRLRLVGRGAAIFAVGLVLELLGTGIAVILTLYGVLYVAALPFLRWRRRSLWATAAGLAVLGPPLLALLLVVAPGAADWSGPGVGLVLGIYPVTVWLALLLAGLALGRTDLASLRTAAVLLVAGAATAGAAYGTAEAVSAHVADLQDETWGGSGSSYDSSYDSSYETSGWTVVPGDEVDLDGMVCDDYGDGVLTCYPEEGVVLGIEQGSVSSWSMG